MMNGTPQRRAESPAQQSDRRIIPITTSVVRENLGALPRAAIVYAVGELARRAGVSPEFFEKWRISFDSLGALNIYVQPGTDRRIRFPSAPPKFWDELRAGIFRTSTAAWIGTPPASVRRLVPNFKVPFSSTDRAFIGPLFALASSRCVECSVDLPASIVLTLSRYEETFPVSRDKHGRFSAYDSIAWRDSFLDRPIVDEYGLAFEEALRHLLPKWQPPERKLHVKLSHDVDEIGLPFRLRTTIGHTMRRGQPNATIRDFRALFQETDTTYQHLLRQVVGWSVEHRLDAAVYWKCSQPGPFDTGYNPRDPRIREMIASFRAHGVEMGVHPSYRTFDSPQLFRQEIASLQELLGETHLGGRQDYLRWKPGTWAQWESMGLAYDGSVGFADRIGFRAGTAYNYRPWLLEQRRIADLIEIPLLAMDSTLQDYMKLDAEDAFSRLREYVARCRVVGGIFTLVWHNTKLTQFNYSNIYRRLLAEIAGADGNEMIWNYGQ
jgi:uncharacterized protein DUF7033